MTNMKNKIEKILDYIRNSEYNRIQLANEFGYNCWNSVWLCSSPVRQEAIVSSGCFRLLLDGTIEQIKEPFWEEDKLQWFKKEAEELLDKINDFIKGEELC